MRVARQWRVEVRHNNEVVLLIIAPLVVAVEALSRMLSSIDPLLESSDHIVIDFRLY